MKKLFSITLLLFFCVSLLPLKSDALSLMPPQLNYNLNPGDVITETLRLYDDALQGATIYPAVFNFTQKADEQGTIQILTKPEEQNEDIKWVKISQTKISVPASGDIVELPITITIPKDATPGAHLISIAFRNSPNEEIEQPGEAKINLVSQLLCTIFINVIGPAVEQADVDFQVGRVATKNIESMLPQERAKLFSGKKFFIRPPVDFLVNAQNTGTTILMPSGNIKIFNDLLGGGEVGEQLVINPQKNRILPDSERAIATPRFGDGFMFGKYRAKLTFIYGEQAQAVEKVTSFWIVPVIEIAIALAIILIIILIIILTRRYLQKRRARHEDKHEKEMIRRIKEEMDKK